MCSVASQFLAHDYCLAQRLSLGEDAMPFMFLHQVSHKNLLCKSAPVSYYCYNLNIFTCLHLTYQQYCYILNVFTHLHLSQVLQLYSK